MNILGFDTCLDKMYVVLAKDDNILDSKIVETKEVLSCRPCGIHGFNSCPKGHFKCADINVEDLVTALL